MKKGQLKSISLSLALISVIGFTGCLSEDETSTDTDNDSGVENIDTEIESNNPAETTDSNVLRGTIALGDGASSIITLIGSANNRVIGTSDSNGSYSVDASSLTQPIMIKAVLDETGDTMYSFAESNSGVVNITPLTTFVVNQAAEASGVSGGATQLFSQFESGTAPSQLSENIETEENNLNEVVGTVMVSNNVEDFDHFNGEFDANHEGYDAVLDELDIEVYQDDIIIREGNRTIDTLNYDIQEENIDIVGSITDITTNEIIENVTITLEDSAGNIITSSSNQDGIFEISVETMRVYDITISAIGYQTQIMPDIPSFVFTESNIGSISMIPIGESTDAHVSGSIIDGRTERNHISDVNMTFRSGYGNKMGESVAEVTTNTHGNYELTVTVGVYTVEISHSDYYTVFQEIVVYGNENVENFSLLADLSGSTDFFATISLNWDSNPSDLDSHLTGPIVDSNERFHLSYNQRMIDSSYIANYNEYSSTEEDEHWLNIYREAMQTVTGNNYSDMNEEQLWAEYDNLSDDDMMAVDDIIFDESDDYYNTVETITPCASGEIASLDRDRTDDYDGLYPETTTICNVEDGGLYKYYVHNYSDESSMNSGNAQVTVATANGMTHSFNAPVSDTDENVWHVFNIDADGNVYPVNQMIGYDDEGMDNRIYSAPTRLKTDIRFNTEKGLFDNLPSK